MELPKNRNYKNVRTALHSQKNARHTERPTPCTASKRRLHDGRLRHPRRCPSYPRVGRHSHPGRQRPGNTHVATAFRFRRCLNQQGDTALPPVCFGTPAFPRRAGARGQCDRVPRASHRRDSDTASRPILQVLDLKAMDSSSRYRCVSRNHDDALGGARKLFKTLRIRIRAK